MGISLNGENTQKTESPNVQMDKMSHEEKTQTRELTKKKKRKRARKCIKLLNMKMDKEIFFSVFFTAYINTN